MKKIFFLDEDGRKRYSLNFDSYKLNIHEKGSEFEPKAFFPNSGSLDICFLSIGSIERWLIFLKKKNIKIIEGPVERIGAVGKMLSIYIRDPDNNLIEISKKL